MMGQFWRTKDFKSLIRTWNKKLDESGFTDAEVELRDDRVLKQRATNSYRQASQLERESRLEYFVLLGQLAHNTSFNNELERFVMLKHAEGASIKEIVDEINQKGIGRDRKTIRYIIRRWQMKWGIKHWSLKQMNLKKQVIK